MSATIGPSADPTRRLPSSSIPRIDAATIPSAILDGFAGILQADAYGGFNRLYESDRKPGPVLEAACWAHARRKFFVLAEIGLNARRKLAVVAPLAVEAIRSRMINGAAAADRLARR